MDSAAIGGRGWSHSSPTLAPSLHGQHKAYHRRSSVVARYNAQCSGSVEPYGSERGGKRRGG